MNNKIIETLEFHKVRQKIEPYLLTEQGFEELRQLEPMVEVHRIQQAFDELTDIAQIFVENPYFSLSATSDIGPAMRRLELDTDLNIAELLAVKKVLEVSKSLLDFYSNLENVSLSQLNKLFEKIELFHIYKAPTVHQ